jgi:hypothetical protein
MFFSLLLQSYHDCSCFQFWVVFFLFPGSVVALLRFEACLCAFVFVFVFVSQNREEAEEEEKRIHEKTIKRTHVNQDTYTNIYTDHVCKDFLKLCHTLSNVRTLHGLTNTEVTHDFFTSSRNCIGTHLTVQTLDL